MRLKPLPRLARTLAPALILAPLLAVGNAGCLLQHHATTNPLAADKSAQPDKALYDLAMADMDKGKYTVARLNLETLLNTYPDSEYLAQAKMAVADSWYREGGTEGMAQAEAQYKDFITFFPAMQEASEAQLKIATIHFRQLQKPDRDPTEADRAQAELRTFLTNYPDSPLRNQALEMLRETQEVLAEREYRIGLFYLQRAQIGDFSDYRPAQSRLEEVLSKYPLYSRGDVALDQLANSYVTTYRLYTGAASLEGIPASKNLYLANADVDRTKAIQDFSGLIERYPLSPLAQDATKKLTALHAPVPKPTQAAIAFNRSEIASRQAALRKMKKGFRADVGNIWNGKPTLEMTRADQVGEPALSEPAPLPPEPAPGLDVLIKQTMIATGALAANASPAAVDAALASAGISIPSPTPALGEPANPATPAAAANATAAAPLALQDVTDAKSQGADTPDTNTPQATTGSNYNDPNARPVAAPTDPKLLLTPNEIDIENREQIMAADIHRDVPPPVAKIRAEAKKQAETQAKLIDKLRQQQRQNAQNKNAAPTSPAPAAASAASVPALPNPTLPTNASKPWYHIW